MKKKMKTVLKATLKVVLVIIWTVAVVMGVLLLNKDATKDYTQQGTNLTFNISSRDIEIKNTDATIKIEGASRDYFQLKKTDEILYSIPIKPPLDYGHDTYFTLSENNIFEGKWGISNDKEVTFNLVSNKPIEVIFHYNGNSIFPLVITIIGLLFWLLGFFAIDDFVNKKFVIKD